MDRVLDTRLLRFRSRPDSENVSALARDLLDAGRGGEAMEVAAEGLRAQPTDPELLLTLGRALFSAGDLIRAQAVLTEAAKGMPSSPVAYRVLGEVLLARNDAPRAAKVLGRAIAVAPNDREIRELHERASRAARDRMPAAAPPRAPAPPAPPPAASPPKAAQPAASPPAAPAPPPPTREASPSPKVAPVQPPKAPPVERVPMPKAAPSEARAPRAAGPAGHKLPAGLWSSPPKAAPAGAAAEAPPSTGDASKGRAPKGTVMGVGLGRRPDAGPLKLKATGSEPPAAAPPVASAGAPAAPAPPKEPAVEGQHAVRRQSSARNPAAFKATMFGVAPPGSVFPPPPDASEGSASSQAVEAKPEPKPEPRPAPAPEPPRASSPSTRAPKLTTQGLGDSERPTAARAAAFDPDTNAVLLGDLKPFSSSMPPTAIMPSVDLDIPPPAAVPRVDESAAPKSPANALWDESFEVDPSPAPAVPVAPSAKPAEMRPSRPWPTPGPVPSALLDTAVEQPSPAAEPSSVEVEAPAFPSDMPLPPLSSPPVVAADVASGASVGAPDAVPEVLRLLGEQGVFEAPDGWVPPDEAAAGRRSHRPPPNPDGTAALEKWTPSKDVVRPGQRMARSMSVLWVVGVLLVVGGYFGSRYWIDQRHAKATRLIAESVAHALRGDHRDLIDAERKLRFARDLHPQAAETMKTLLFVQSERALEEGSFEPGFMRPTLARADADGLKAPELDAAKAVVAQADGDISGAKKFIEAARNASPKDGRILYIAGRLEQRLGDAAAPEDLEAAMKGSPAPTAAAIAYAESLADDGRSEDAMRVLDQVLASNRGHLRASLWRALIAAADEDADAALGRLDGLVKHLDVGAPTDRVLAGLTRARLLRRKNDAAGATAAVDEAVKAGAQEPRLLGLVAEAARSLGLVTRAQAAAMDAVARAPMNPDFRKLLAGILLERRDGVRALRHLEGLSTDDPTVLTMSARAALLVGTEKLLQQASETLSAYIDKHDDANVEMQALALRLAAALGQADTALVRARTLRKASPEDPAALLALGDVALAAHQAAEAKAALADLVNLAPSDADAHYLLGRAQRLARDLGAAEASFRKAMELSPTHVGARSALGRLLVEAGKYEEADKLYEALAREVGSVEGADNVVIGRLGRAEALLGLGRVTDARAQVDSLTEEQRKFESVKLMSAAISVAEGKPGEAVVLLRPLAEAEGAAAETIVLYGNALAEAGQTDVANQQFDRALAIDAAFPEALVGKANAAVRAERPKDAHKYLDAAEVALETRVRPDRLKAELYTLRGRAFILEGRPKVEAARAVLRQAVNTPGVPNDAYFFLGESLSAANSPEAFDAYAKYLELEPDGYYKKRAERAMRRK